MDSEENATALYSQDELGDSEKTMVIWARVFTIMALTIAPFGLFLNTLSFIVLRRLRESTSSHIYLQALAVCDCISILFDGIIDSVQKLTYNDVLYFDSVILCRIDILLDYVTTYVTYWIIVVISWDRVMTTYYPMTHQPRWTHARAYTLLALIVATCYSIGTGCILFVANIENKDGRCEESEKGEMVLYSIIGGGAVLPLVAVAVLNMLLLAMLGRPQWFFHHPTAAGETAARTDELRITVTVSLVFLLLCGTSQLLTVYHRSHTKRGFHMVADSVDELLNVLNSSLNFIIYFLWAERFRRKLRELIYPLLGWQTPPSGPSRHSQNRTTRARSSRIKTQMAETTA